MSIRRDITEHFREGIIAGRYPAGTALPPTREIAERYGTRPANVQRALALLVEEGLIVREPRVGTRVRLRQRELKTVALYLSHPGAEMLLPYRRYYWRELARELAGRGISTRTVVEDQAGNGLASLRRLADSDRIQAVIFIELDPEEIRPLLKLPVPVLGYSVSGMAPHVGIDYRSLLPGVLPELKRCGCRQLAVISSMRLHDQQYGYDWGVQTSLRRFEEQHIRLDFRAQPSASLHSLEVDDFVQFGYRSFRQLMTLPERPDALLVYPDKLLPGVLAAAYELKIDLEQEFRRIFIHRNRELPELFPVRAYYLEIQLRELVERSVELLFNLHRHQGPKKYLVKHHLYDPEASTQGERG